MKESLENRPQLERYRFDYVIGNPPYVSYNQCSKQRMLIFELMQNGKAQLNNIYGVNLHSIPERHKKYAPKPNLYAFFIALGLALLKDDGRLCYIIPQTVLVNNDLDVIRYHLARFSTIEKIITFRQKMFIGRGLKQNKPVVTSSLIFVVSRKSPGSLHQVEITNYTDPEDDIETALNNILGDKKCKKVSRHRVLQSKLFQQVNNWNFIKHGKEFIDLYDQYLRQTEDISLYYSHSLAEHYFKNRFYFDGSTNIPKKDLLLQPPSNLSDYYVIPSLKSEAYISGIEGWYPKIKEIKIAHGSQGVVVAEPRYKVLWRYINHDRFYYMDGDNILPIYQQYCVTSNDKKEILYLFSILNSKLTDLILKKLLKVEQEERLSFLLGLTSIKEFVRVPKIMEDNQHIKNKIIELTEALLDIERVTLGDLVDFSGVMTQKFDSASVKDDHLILGRGNAEMRLVIKKEKGLVRKTIESDSRNIKLELEDKEISLSDLMSMPTIDFERQKAIKDYIDDLVFALYFNVDIPKDTLNQPETTKQLCQKSKFYKLTQNEGQKVN